MRKKPFTPEERKKIVEAHRTAVEEGQGSELAAKQLGVSLASIYLWRHKIKRGAKIARKAARPEVIAINHMPASRVSLVLGSPSEIAEVLRSL